MRRVMQTQVPVMLCAGRRIADLACNDVDAVGSVGGAGRGRLSQLLLRRSRRTLSLPRIRAEFHGRFEV